MSEPAAGPCPLCGARGPVRAVHRRGGWTVVACRACGHGRTEPPPDPDALARAYADPEYYAGRAMSAAVLPDDRARARRLALATAPGARVLEVGSGTGALLRAMLDEGLRPVGLEPWPDVAREAARAHGVDVRVADVCAPAFELDERFDAAVMVHVLEHLAEPVLALSRVRAILRPRGLLVVEVPNRGSLAARLPWRREGIYDLPVHLHHFTAGSLRRALDDAGFDGALVLPSIPRPLDRAAGWLRRALGRARAAGAAGAGPGEPPPAGPGEPAPAGSGRVPFVIPPSRAGRLLRTAGGSKLLATATAPEPR